MSSKTHMPSRCSRTDSRFEMTANGRRSVRIVSLSEVKRMTGLSRSSLYLHIKDRKFPAPIKAGGRTVGWVEEEVVQWTAKGVKESRRT